MANTKGTPGATSRVAAGSAGVSTSSVISTLVANLILFAIFVSCFLALRHRFRRIYSPKSTYDYLVEEEKRPEPLPKDPFRWVYVLLTKPHSFIIQQAGLDGYFFLRYMLVMATFFLFALLTWLVLFPVNIVNGAGQSGLDQLSISNVNQKSRYWGHAVMSCFLYGGMIYVIYRELFFFNSFRAAVLASPRYAHKLSSRTVLFQSVPDVFLDEKQFFKLFNGVKRIYVARTNKKLESLVKKREEKAFELENAENQLLKKAVKYKIKAEKKGLPIDDPSDVYSYVPEKKRPKMKSGGFFSKKVDKITRLREEIPKLDKEVRDLQKRYRSGRPKNSIFVEFDNQYAAQVAYQTVTHHNPMRMGPAYTGIEPADVQWSNLRIFWWERITRRFIASVVIIVLILFWAIPVAFVGMISNINSLTNLVPFLKWILDIPDVILGVITGLLPSVMLALLLATLPIFIRAMAKVAGCVSAQQIEMYTQTAYFGFLIVNGFLVTTISSSATSTVTKIIEQPTSAMSILAQNLPKSSNFYISYLILQGLSVAGGALFQVVTLFLYYVLGRFLDTTVRKKWDRFASLGEVAWGTAFPIFTNLACITLAYAIISPLIIAFASVAYYLVYIAYCHNLTYVFTEGPDARGSHYPRALFQTFTGIYLGQVCLLGLFVVGKGWGPIVLQLIGLGCTVFCHLNMNEAFDHLLTVVPIDTMKPLDGVSHTSSFNGQSDYKEKVLDKKRLARSANTFDKLERELAEDAEATLQVKNDMNVNVFEPENEKALVPLLADRDYKNTRSSNFLVQFIRPDVFLNFRHAKELLPACYNIEPVYEDNKHAYDEPIVSQKMPTLWIPADPMGLSKIEIEENSKFINITDENTSFNEKGRPIFLGKPPA